MVVTKVTMTVPPLVMSLVTKEITTKTVVKDNGDGSKDGVN